MQYNLRISLVVAFVALLIAFLPKPTSAQVDTLPAAQTDHTIIDLTVSTDDVAVDFARADFWSRLPGGTRPNNGLFVAFVGEMTGYADNACLYDDDFILEIGGQSYELSNRMGKVKRTYGYDYPGGILGQCVDDGETEGTFILFDIPEDADGQAKLLIDGQTATLAMSLPDLLADSTPPPTPTPRPTRAPTRTPTLQATNTPTPIPTPTPTPDPVADYATELNTAVSIYIEGLGAIGQQLTASGEDIALIFDEDWRMLTATAIGYVYAANEQVRSLTPPVGLEQTHNALLQAADQYELAMNGLATGLDEMDTDSLVAAMAAMEAGTALMTESQSLMEAFIEQRDAQTEELAALGTPAQVVDIVDGDTIDVLIDGQPDTVRYIGIDTPERRDPGYSAATQANAQLVEGQKVYLVTDVTDRDRYDRLLRYVYLADGTHVNAELIAQGHAQPVEYEPDTSNAAEFRQLAVEAARAGRGFWSGGNDVMHYGMTTGGINLRKGPGTDFAINTSLPADTPLTIFGRNQDGSWVQVRTPDRSGGWLFANLLTLNVPVMNINIAGDIPTLEAAPVEDTNRSTTVDVVPQQQEAQPEEQPAPQQAEPPTAEEAQEQAPSISIGNATLFIIENNSTLEILGVRNDGGGDVDIGGWTLDGSKGDDRCFIPNGTVLTPSEVFQIATGDSVVSGRGIKCGDKPIWNNNGETIYLHGRDGQVISIESVRR